MNKFSERLQHVASIKKLFQADLARDLHKDRGTISRWWSGEITPGAKNMRLIADYLKCDLEWLATGTGVPFPTHGDQAKGSENFNSDLKERPETVAQLSHPSETIDFTHEQEEFTIREMVNMTMEVLESGTVYKSALASSIRAFHKAVKQEGAMKSVEEDVAEMRERMERMEQMLLSLGARLPEKRD